MLGTHHSWVDWWDGVRCYNTKCVKNGIQSVEWKHTMLTTSPPGNHNIYTPRGGVGSGDESNTPLKGAVARKRKLFKFELRNVVMLEFNLWENIARNAILYYTIL